VRYKVQFTAEARKQVDAALRWWRENRPKNRGLFREELIHAVVTLRTTPRGGVRYEPENFKDVHCHLMPRSHYDVYYVVNDGAGMVTVIALWHQARGEPPAALRPR
jgi:hypothetical protein